MAVGVGPGYPAPAGKKKKQQGAPKQGRNAYAYLELPTNKQLHEESTAATNVAYRPVERQTKANLKASNKRIGEEGNWWNEYLATVGQSQGATQQAYADAAAQTQGLINTGSAVDTANTAKLNTEQGAAAAARGQDASAANAATTQTANSALSQRNTQLGTLGAATAGQGANQYAYLANQRNIGAGQRVAAMTTEAKRGNSIRNDLTSLARERGDYAEKTLGQKAAEARETKLKKEAFHLEAKGQVLSAKAEHEKAEREYQEHLDDQKAKGAEIGIDQQNANTAAQGARTDQYEAHHPGSSNGPSQSEKRDAHQAKENAWKAAKSLYLSEAPPATPQEWAQFESHLAESAEVSPAAAAAAVHRLKETYGRGGPQGGIHR